MVDDLNNHLLSDDLWANVVPMNLTIPRPYQTEAVQAVLKEWREHRSCMATVATGGGKTLIAALLASMVKDRGRILFLANRNELCSQPVAVFKQMTQVRPELEKADDYAGLDSQIVIGSVQTMSRAKRLERFASDHFSYIIADEAHMSAAESWKRIFDRFPQAKLLGITATPFRADAKKLTDIFEVEAYRKDLLALVDEGYLVNPDHVDKLSTAIDLANVRVKKSVEGMDYDLQDAADAIEPWFIEIAKEIAQKHAQRHILAFLPLIASSQKFVAACVAAGLNAVHVDGDDPERDRKLTDFREGKIQLLSNSNLLHTGIDIPQCDATLNLRPTKSKVLYCQIVGRSTRTVPGLIDNLDSTGERLQAIAGSAKPRAYIIDPLWLTKDHDLCTPAFLVAQNEEEAYEMRKRAPGSYSLRSLRDEVQREREEAIRRRLINVATFRQGKVDAKYFAACAPEARDLHILSYEPVYGWETQAPTTLSRAALESRGIDPETVTSEGEARTIIRAINIRRYRRLPEIRHLGWIMEEVPEDILWRLTNKDLQRFIDRKAHGPAKSRPL